MRDVKSFATVTEAMNDLKKRGYTRDFNLRETFIECSSSGEKYGPNDFEITETYRFEGNTDPGDEMVLYAVVSKKGDARGTLVSAFGPYSDVLSDELLAKLKFHK